MPHHTRIRLSLEHDLSSTHEGGAAFSTGWHDVCHLAQPPTPMYLFLATFSKDDFSPLRSSLGLGKIR
jgi:hypothetical protein